MTTTTPHPRLREVRTRGLVLGWAPTMTAGFQSLGVETISVIPQRYWNRVGMPDILDGICLLVERYDVEEILSSLSRREIDTDDLRFIVAGDEFAIVCAATLAEALGRSDITISTALACRDKTVQKRRIREHGIPCADWQAIDPVTAFVGREAEYAGLLPGVLKPVSQASTIGTMRVESIEQLAKELNRLVAENATAHILESWVEGREMHSDGVVENGRIVAFGVTRYRHNLLTVREGNLLASITLDPTEHATLYAEMRELTDRSLRAVGLTDGIFHLEAFHGPDGFVFGELAARAGGVYVIDVMIRKFGVNLPYARARAALGLPQQTLRVPDRRSFGQTVLWLPPGVIRRMPTLVDVEARPGVELASLDVQPGDTMVDTRYASTARAGLALLIADDETELERRMDDLTAWFADASLIESPA